MSEVLYMNTHTTNHTSTRKKSREEKAKLLAANDSDSIRQYADLLKLRSLSALTQEEYLRHLRKLAKVTGKSPEALSEQEVRAYLLRLKTERKYSPSSMRTVAAALSTFYNTQEHRDWKLGRV